VLVLPGGRQRDYRPLKRNNLVSLRMGPFVRSIRRRAPRSAVVLVQYRHRGWNNADPVEDVEFVHRLVRDRYGPLPMVLVGHSMGGRAALRSAGLADVRGVAALAPWIPNGEPVAQLAGRQLLLLHGTRDQTTSPEATARFAARALPIADQVTSLGVMRSGHTMLSRASVWHRLTSEFVAAVASGKSISEIGSSGSGVELL
jgi:dienelactone hydrolase